MSRITALPPRSLPLTEPDPHDPSRIVMTLPWFMFFKTLRDSLVGGEGTTALPLVVATAKLTGGGANGSLTFINGILVGETAAT